MVTNSSVQRGGLYHFLPEMSALAQAGAPRDSCRETNKKGKSKGSDCAAGEQELMIWGRLMSFLLCSLPLQVAWQPSRTRGCSLHLPLHIQFVCSVLKS